MAILGGFYRLTTIMLVISTSHAIYFHFTLLRLLLILGLHFYDTSINIETQATLPASVMYEPNRFEVYFYTVYLNGR